MHFTGKPLRHLKFKMSVAQHIVLSPEQTPLHYPPFPQVSQHSPLTQARDLRVILALILSEETNQTIFHSYPFCLISSSHVSSLHLSLDFAVVFLSRIWPPVVPVAAPFLEDNDPCPPAQPHFLHSCRLSASAEWKCSNSIP